MKVSFYGVSKMLLKCSRRPHHHGQKLRYAGLELGDLLRKAGGKGRNRRTISEAKDASVPRSWPKTRDFWPCDC